MSLSATPKRPRILAIVGPTASGKSRLAVLLAERLNGEVVSCDSMQVYRGMDIGTAKPTAAEMCGIPHHLIDLVSPDRVFTCADYVQACRRVIAEITARGKLPILCGGTGLYLERLLFGGTEPTETAPDPAIRAHWQAYLAAHGAHELHLRLREVDPASADAIHENNLPRVIRALEIYTATGIPKSEWDRRTQLSEPAYDALVIGLRFEDRETLYDRINRRVDQMLADGLSEETRRLKADGVFAANATAAQAIGYKELLGYLDGTESLEAATEQLRTATRRYAKRQMTWFSAKPYLHWLTVDRTEDLLADALALVEDKRPWGSAPSPA